MFSLQYRSPWGKEITSYPGLLLHGKEALEILRPRERIIAFKIKKLPGPFGWF